MTTSADVAVVIPTFDRPALLVTTVESAIGQTVAPREIVVVDNGVNPETPAALARFGDRLRYLKIEPGGVQIARNAGIAAASATWIALLDDDDLFLPGYLAAALPAMLDGRSDVVGTDHIKFEDGRYDSETNFEMAPPGYWDEVPKPLDGADWSFVGSFPLDRLLLRIPIYPSAMIIRRSFAQAIGGYDPKMRPVPTEDIEFLVRALNRGALSLVWKPLVAYRRHAGSATAGAHRQMIGRWRVFEFVRRNVVDLDPAFVAALDVDLPRRRVRIFDSAFESGCYELAPEVAPLLRPEDWTIARRLKLVTASLPSPLPPLIDRLFVRTARAVIRR